MNDRPSPLWARVAARPRQALAVLAVCAVAAGVLALAARSRPEDTPPAKADTDLSSQSKRQRGIFRPTQAQWAGLTIQGVQQRAFRAEIVTDGKIAVDEDRSTPIFSP